MTSDNKPSKLNRHSSACRQNTDDDVQAILVIGRGQEVEKSFKSHWSKVNHVAAACAFDLHPPLAVACRQCVSANKDLSIRRRLKPPSSLPGNMLSQLASSVCRKTATFGPILKYLSGPNTFAAASGGMEDHFTPNNLDSPDTFSEIVFFQFGGLALREVPEQTHHDIVSLADRVWGGLMLMAPKKRVSHARKRRRLVRYDCKNITHIETCRACGKQKLQHRLCKDYVRCATANLPRSRRSPEASRPETLGEKELRT